MTRLDGRFILEATGGRAIGPAVADGLVRGIVTDSRDEVAGRCFVALRGPRHDGHDHLDAVAEAGAAMALVADGARVPAGLPAVAVPDPRRGLGRLAAAWRDTLRGPVVAVTGSVGKTTVKEMLRAILEAWGRGRVTAAPSSFNNDVGLPCTLLAAAPDDAFTVVEIGTGGPGEIRRLTAIARPDVAIITTIGHAHLGAFGDRDAIAREKADLVLGAADGAALLVPPGPPALHAALAPRAADLRLTGDAPHTVARRVAAGEGESGAWVEVARPGRPDRRFSLALAGAHHADNAVTAIAAAGALGVPDEAIERGLAAVRLPGMRMQRHRVGGVHVHDDAWNASPESMEAAIRTFDAATRSHVAAGGRRVAILGDMLELGPDAPRLHRTIGATLALADLAAPFAAVITVGRHAALIAAAASVGDRTVAVERLDGSVRRTVLDRLEPGDHVLLKGSRGIGLERVVRWLDDGVAGAAAAGAPGADRAADPSALPSTRPANSES